MLGFGQKKSLCRNSLPHQNTTIMSNPMTLPEDVREKVRSEITSIAEYCYNVGTDRLRLVRSIDATCKRLEDLLTSAKAEGFQEGVKAMSEEVKKKTYYDTSIVGLEVLTTLGNEYGYYIDAVADQLLNQDTEMKEA